MRVDLRRAVVATVGLAALMVATDAALLLLVSSCA